MHWGFIVLLIIIFIVILIMITKVNIELFYAHDQDNDELTIKFNAWFGLLSYTMSVPLIKVDKDSASIIIEEEQKVGQNDLEDKKRKITPNLIINKMKEMQDFLRHVKGLHKIMRHFLKNISVTKFEWQTQLGIGDAAHTGVLAGIAWGIKGTAIGIVSHLMLLKTKPKIAVQPAYQSKQSFTRLRCMFSFRIGHAIGAGIKIARHWKRRKKKWQTILYKT
ncbi:DUF2953 domain-containing protein [Anaerobacillus sp. MEB173]|uniref:DUF2953 domain-containing protein n=1 Tax=Anaerobacillus sp. MEB173 TaxID=3383345 RepID=UPI003F937255